ncbi:MAG: hypothetical protein ACYS47_19375 [Planctomycetota bacterium]|jgi:hypothetical protein
MKLKRVSRYEQAKYPTLSNHVESKDRGRVWSGRALALAVAALAAVMSGCLPGAS